jgi:hypothetical protein
MLLFPINTGRLGDRYKHAILFFFLLKYLSVFHQYLHSRKIHCHKMIDLEGV